ncbi:MAG TPA: helix-turn-helix transcriptional regulator [Emticicia sp.]
MTITNRFLEVCELLIEKGYVKNLSQLAQRANMSKSQISDIKNGRTKIGSSTIQKLLTSFPVVNSEWLFTGNGNMISGNIVETEDKSIEYPSTDIQNRFILVVDGLGKSDRDMATELGLTEEEFKIAIERYLIRWSFILKFCSHYEINTDWLISKDAPIVNSVIDIIKRFTDDGKQIEGLSLNDQQELNKRLAIRQEIENRVKHWSNITEQEFSLKQYHLKIDRELRTEDSLSFELLFNSRKLMALSKDLDNLVKAYIAPIINIVGNYTQYDDFKRDYIKNLQSKQIYTSAITSAVKKLQKFVERDFSKFDSQQVANEFSKLMKIEQRKFGKGDQK